MGLAETEAIVLRTYSLAEADKIVVCLTRSAGVIRGVAHGARRLKSRFGASLEPFTLLSLGYYEKEGRELVTLNHTEIIRSYFGLSGNEEVVAALAYMGELLIEFAPPHAADERLFRMVRACLEALSAAPEDLPAIVRYYELWMLKLAGFLPDLRVCGDCHKQLAGEEATYLNAEFRPRCQACSHGAGNALSKGALAQWRAAQRLPPAAFAAGTRELTKATRQELAQVIQRLIWGVLERDPRGQAAFS